MVARVVPQSARRRHAESRKPDLWGRAARPKAPVLALACATWQGHRLMAPAVGRFQLPFTGWKSHTPPGDALPPPLAGVSNCHFFACP